MGSMGPGMMSSTHQQMTGMMQQIGVLMAGGQMSPERMKQMGERMTRMGSMGARGGIGSSIMGFMGMPEMPKMMEHMAEMQMRLSDMMGAQEPGRGEVVHPFSLKVMTWSWGLFGNPGNSRVLVDIPAAIRESHRKRRHHTMRIAAVLVVGLSSSVLALAQPASAAQLFTSWVFMGSGQVINCVVTNITNRDIAVHITARDNAGTIVSDQPTTVPALGTITTPVAQSARCGFKVASKNSIRANLTLYSVVGAAVNGSLIVLPAE
jgi:hypothetical protein